MNPLFIVHKNLFSLKFSIVSYFTKMKAVEKKIQPEKKSRFQSIRFKM